MDRVGLFLSGAGSLDGSDVMTSVLAYMALQENGYDPVPIARSIDQGRVVNHRNAQPQDETRNSLVESARVVRGEVQSMRDVEAEDLDGSVLVGGDGTLSTWTDYHEREAKCRITERLKYHLLDLIDADAPILCLGNAAFVVGLIFRDRSAELTVNVGSNAQLEATLESWGIELTDRTPCWDSENRVGSLPGVSRNDDLPAAYEDLTELIQRSLDESVGSVSQ